MPVSIDIVDFKCFNQLRNGVAFTDNLSEFTPNLVGNIGENLRVTFTAYLSQTAYTEGAEEWEMYPTIDQIVRSSGSFLDDQIQIGDEFLFYADWDTRNTAPGGFEYVATVNYLSSDGKTLGYTVTSGADTTGGVHTNIGLVFDQSAAANQNTAVFLKFGLLGNEETFNYQSKTTEAAQVYYAGGATPGVLVTAQSLGSIKDWVTGEVVVRFESGTPALPHLGSARYTISHKFTLNPFYILAYRSFIDAGTIPELLEGDNSLKYAWELEFRKTLTNTGSSKIQSFDTLEGFTGWYGENFNGLNTEYRVKSVAYDELVSGDPLDGININTSTVVTVIVNTGGAITDYSCAVYLIKIPTSESEYIGTTTDMLTNFAVKSEIVSSPATTSANVTTSLVGGELVIEYTVAFSTPEKLLLNTDTEYMLLVQVEDPTLTAGNSDRVMLIAALRNYVDIDFLAGFVQSELHLFLQYNQNLTDNLGQINPIVSNEDAVLLNAVIGADVTKGVVINSVVASLIAYNSTEGVSFPLDTFDFNIGNPVIVGGVQNIEVDALRGYPLAPGDEFNLARITTGVQVGDFKQYSIQLGQKIKWQEWIFNPVVDDVFFDASEPNSNLNEKASNYSGLEGYQIKLALAINVSGLDDLGRTVEGDVVLYGGDIDVYDYDASEDGVSGVIQTFDLETGTSLDGNILYNGKDTLFKAVFSDAENMGLAIHRIEPTQNQGDGILELSNFSDYVPAPLKPLSGETRLKTTLVGTTLTTECLIDGASIQEGVTYKLSARALQQPVDFSNAFTFTVDTTKAGSASNTFVLPLIASGNYDFFVNWGDDTLDQITAWDQAEKTHVYATSGVHEIKITGTLEGWRFAIVGDCRKITNISNWGNGLSFAGARLTQGFDGCLNLVVTTTDTPQNIDTCTSLSRTFAGCTLFNPGNINDWPVTSDLTNMAGTFLLCVNFNQPLSAWDVSGVTNFSQAFDRAAIFNQSLNAWDVSAGTDFSIMFSRCNSFNSYIGDWVLTSATTFERMFELCPVFNSDISGWVMPAGAFDCTSMFDGAVAFNQNISGWVMDTCTNISQMFDGAVAFNQDISTWDVSSVINFSFAFRNATTFNQDISTWELDSATNISGMFFGATAFNQPIGAWDVSTIADLSSLFQGATAFNRPLPWTFANGANMEFMLAGATAFNQDISGWVLTNLTSLRRVFDGATSFNQDISGWDVSNITNFTGLFMGATAFSFNLNGWDTSAGTSFFEVFRDTNYNQPLSGWVVSAATRFEGMFRNNPAFNQDISGWVPSSAQEFEAMFNGATAFDQDISGWVITSVNNALNMFAGGAGLSTANYDALLVGWGGQAVLDNVTFNAGASEYTPGGAADTARAALIADHSWTIIDGGAA